MTGNIVLMFLVILTGKSFAAPVTLDQRQDGEFNLQASFDNFLFLIAIPTGASGGSQNSSSSAFDNFAELFLERRNKQTQINHSDVNKIHDNNEEHGSSRSDENLHELHPKAEIDVHHKHQHEDHHQQHHHHHQPEVKPKEAEVQKPKELPAAPAAAAAVKTGRSVKRDHGQIPIQKLTDKTEPLAKPIGNKIIDKLPTNNKPNKPEISHKKHQTAETTMLAGTNHNNKSKPHHDLKHGLKIKNIEDIENPENLKLIGEGVEKSCGPGRHYNKKGICEDDLIKAVIKEN